MTNGALLRSGAGSAIRDGKPVCVPLLRHRERISLDRKETGFTKNKNIFRALQAIALDWHGLCKDTLWPATAGPGSHQADYLRGPRDDTAAPGNNGQNLSLLTIAGA